MDTRDRVAVDARDRSVADAHSKSTMANVVGWLALILSVIALVLAWTAYNSASDENLGEKIEEGLRGVTQVEEQRQDELNTTTPSDDAVAPTVEDGTVMNDGTTTTPESGDTTLPETNN